MRQNRPSPSRSHPPPITIPHLMCKSKSSIQASTPHSLSSSTTTTTTTTTLPTHRRATAITTTSSSSSNSNTSLSSLRDALPPPPQLFPLPDLSAATRRPPLPLSSAAWRCTLSDLDAVVTRRALRSPQAAHALPLRLAALAKSHHSALVRLLGAAAAPPDALYLVHEFAPAATPLSLLLRNPRNPTFTPLADWLSRAQIAADLAAGLEYIHHHSSAAAGVHNRLKSSSVLVTDRGFRAKILHFGSADLAGEVDPDGGRAARIEGARGYMAPEILAGERVSRRSDVFAFGVVILELLSGEEPVKVVASEGEAEFRRVSVIETARAAIGADDGGREGRVRRWVDRRMRDSFPVAAAEGLMRVALRCVEAEAAERPDMTWVAGVVSKVYLESKEWAETMRLPTEISVSFAPR